MRRRRGGKGNNRSNASSFQAPSEESSSSASVNNDWQHWVVLQGDDQAAVDEIQGIGEAMGVTYKGDRENSGMGAKSVCDEDYFLECSRIGWAKEEEGALWGNSPHDFSYRPSVGESGGLLSIWDSNEVEVWSTESRENVLWCHGRFIKSDAGGQRVCICGDFNAVKRLEERRLSRGDGLSMSRLDRFLLSEEWCLTWPNYKQEARMRGLSDHCPLILSANEEDWGPCPLRMLKCWKDIPGYYLFVREKRKSLQVDVWGGFVLKEKLKMIKATLNEWHSARIDSLKIHLSTLVQKGEEETLTEAELVELHGVTADIHSLSR
ncbi:hypothetical protein TSUD_27840 [Trifolium subterraneum]|uniref:Endonuclease/exonuclease/phosphatase domain-containing protein n=1 Tax=Trifolium subterraneum TaxID=3900 RepID=A0A2Z6P4Z3_TRISU|nr:hypothetical protein TSUD_27840 [Trifolium subterraneum]